MLFFVLFLLGVAPAWLGKGCMITAILIAFVFNYVDFAGAEDYKVQSESL